MFKHVLNPLVSLSENEIDELFLRTRHKQLAVWKAEICFSVYNLSRIMAQFGPFILWPDPVRVWDDGKIHSAGQTSTRHYFSVTIWLDLN